MTDRDWQAIQQRALARPARRMRVPMVPQDGFVWAIGTKRIIKVMLTLDAFGPVPFWHVSASLNPTSPTDKHLRLIERELHKAILGVGDANLETHRIEAQPNETRTAFLWRYAADIARVSLGEVEPRQTLAVARRAVCHLFRPLTPAERQSINATGENARR